MIRLDRVTKRYGRFVALNELSAEIQPGIVGLLGPNGAGKSTLIKVLLGLVRLSAGEAFVLGHNAKTQSQLVRQHVGYMPEDDCFFNGFTGVQSVAFAGELAGLPRRTALRRAHEMLDYAALGESRYREVQTYSAGMKQRVRLAQALIHSPRIVFLDEPTTGLDPAGRDQMLHLIRNLHHEKGVSVVVSTHILKDVEACCDAVLVLARGRLAAHDTLENLRQPVDPSYQVFLAGDGELFAASLRRAGLRAEPGLPGAWHVYGQGDDVGRRVFQQAAASGAAVRQLVPSRNSLEEIFLRVVSEEPHADL